MTTTPASLPAEIVEAMEEPTFHDGATDDALALASQVLGVPLPQDYVAFMKESDGATFYLGESYLVVYGTGDLADYNAADEDEFPGHLRVFGSNGGSEVFAFDSQTSPPEIVIVPHYQPEPGDALKQGTSFIGFLKRVRADEAFD